MFIEADDDITKLQYKIDYIEQVLFFLDSVLRMINSRTYTSRTLLSGRGLMRGSNELWTLLKEVSLNRQSVNGKKSNITKPRIF